MAKPKGKGKGKSKSNSGKNGKDESAAFSLLLECELNDFEIAGRAHETAERQRELDSLTQEFTETKKDYKKRIDYLALQVRRGLKAVLDAREEREVECRNEFDWATGKVVTVRLDTEEVVDTRDVTEEERQAQFGFEAPPSDQDAVDRTPAGA